VAPPILDPATWEDFAVFRETFLAYFTRPEDAAALRHLGNLAFEMLLEHCRYFPDPPESETRWELRAAVRAPSPPSITPEDDPPSAISPSHNEKANPTLAAPP
jgi:hypothetical protein